MNPSEHTFDARGLKIHYVEWGDRKGELLILIHGFLDHVRSWDPLVAAIKNLSLKPMRIVAMDCRGHGDSGWIGRGGFYHFPDYVLDLNSLILNLGAPSAVLLGHSMGGTISFLYSGTFPHRVEKLILVEGIGPRGLNFSAAPRRMEKWIIEFGALEQRRPIEYSTLEKGVQRLQRSNPRLKPDLALHLARHGMKQTIRGKWVWKFDPLHRTTSPQPFYTGQALEFLSLIECPVLLVGGKESRQSIRKDRKERFNAISNRTDVEIEGAGHMVHHDNAEGLAQVVVEFLKKEKQ